VHWCRRRLRFNEVPEKVPKVPEKVWEDLQSRVRFNRVPEKIGGKVRGGFGAEPDQVQQGSKEGLGGFGAEPGQVQRDLQPLTVTHGNPAEVFPALGFVARFRKICKNKTLRLLGIPPKLI